MKIFVVDDSKIDRTLLISTLQKAGVKNEFIQADDGKAAWGIIQEGHKNICLMFLDWQIPNMDGLEILKRLAGNPETKSLPVIMMTSSGAPEDEEIARLLNPGLKGFVVKPLDPKKIAEIALPHIK